MSVELECSDLGCKGGPGGIKWKSPSLPYEQARIERDSHLLYNHQPPAQASTQNGGGGRSRFEKMKRPTISAGLSLKDWNYFKQEWECYKIDSHDPDAGRTLTRRGSEEAHGFYGGGQVKNN